ncbi:MAG: hypothetical protein V3U20_02840 [Thermoplasmata archaeon]
MAEDLEGKEDLEEEREKTRAQTEAQMLRSRVNDYVAIILALGTVFCSGFFSGWDYIEHE